MGGERVLVTHRQQRILHSIQERAGASVEDLAETLGVSPATIRRDLVRLEEMGLLRRVRGGALPVAQDGLIPLPESRESQRAEEKRRIGAAAAAMVRDDSVIIVDAGTTTKQMVHHLAARRGLTVITRDLRIALALAQYPQIHCVFLGGTVRRSASTAGTLVLRFLQQFHADQVFLGAQGISLDEGIWTSDLEESLVKLESMRRSQRCVVLADSTKLGRSGGVLVAPISEMDVLVTDSGADPGWVEQLASRGVEVIRA